LPEVRTVGVLTTGRQDWGILRSTCARIRDDREFALHLLVGGMHCSATFGNTVSLIEADGFIPSAVMKWVSDRDVPAYVQAADALRAIGDVLSRQRVSMLLLVGDRFETVAAALAATLALTPLVHLHGGEETEGSIDNAFRHAISKLAHLHFVSETEHAQRLIAMGEDPECIHVVGAPGLDNLHRTDLASRDELEGALGLTLRSPLVVVTLHPATEHTAAAEAQAVADALDHVPATYVVTLPNTDPGHARVREALVRACRRPGRVAIAALGERRFWGLLRIADAMLGNSSAGIIEAAALGLPTVNVGDRQKGRRRGANVLDVPPEGAAVADALRTALSAPFRARAAAGPSPYGDGRSAARIVDTLRTWSPPTTCLKRRVKIA
jgi:UDP-hydrolysing UDP-N-acetyl-D-glucosamine 2-epimerase